jgi:hypothetical protein
MANRYWVGGSGTWNTSSTANWSTASGGASGASAPGILDVALFDANSGAGTVTLGANVSVFRVTWSGYAGSFTPSTFEINCVGDGATSLWISGTTATFTAIPTVNFTYSGANSRLVNLGGTVTYDRVVNANITAGTGAFSFSGTTYVNNFNCTGYGGALTAAALVVTGNLTLSATMTFVASASALSFLQSGNKTITTNNVLIDRPISFGSAASGGTWTFTDALTQGATRAFNWTEGTIKLKSGVTSTVGAFATFGTNQKFLASSLAGSQATLSQSSGTVNTSYLTIKDSNATGGAFWAAYVDYQNIDAGNSDGWDFGISPPYASYEPPIIIRSFTQPRRF